MAAFAEGRIRSMKNFLYRYIENHGLKYFQKLCECVKTLKTGTKFLDRFDTKNVKNFDSLPFLYSMPLRDYRKPKFKIGHRVRIYTYDLHFRKR